MSIALLALLPLALPPVPVQEPDADEYALRWSGSPAEELGIDLARLLELRQERAGDAWTCDPATRAALAARTAVLPGNLALRPRELDAFAAGLLLIHGYEVIPRAGASAPAVRALAAPGPAILRTDLVQVPANALESFGGAEVGTVVDAPGGDWIDFRTLGLAVQGEPGVGVWLHASSRRMVLQGPASGIAATLRRMEAALRAPTGVDLGVRFDLRHLPAEEAAAELERALAADPAWRGRVEGIRILPVPGGGALEVIAPARELAELRRLLASLDRPAERAGSAPVEAPPEGRRAVAASFGAHAIRLVHARAGRVAEALRALAADLPRTDGEVSVVLHRPSNSLIVLGTPEQLAPLRARAAELDAVAAAGGASPVPVPPEARSPGFELVRLEHLSPADASQVLSEILEMTDPEGLESGAILLVAETRSRSLLLVAPEPSLKSLREMLERADENAGQRGSGGA